MKKHTGVTEMSNQWMATGPSNMEGAQQPSSPGHEEHMRRYRAPRATNPTPNDNVDNPALDFEPENVPKPERNQRFPPIITIDGRVDTDIDHLMEDAEADVPTETLRRYPKPHVFSVIEGSIDDDVDSLANHDGTMEHTLVDSPRHFSSRDLKDVASKGGKRRSPGRAGITAGADHQAAILRSPTRSYSLSPHRSARSARASMMPLERRSGRSVVLYDRSHNKKHEEDLSQTDDFPACTRSGSVLCVEQSHQVTLDVLEGKAGGGGGVEQEEEAEVVVDTGRENGEGEEEDKEDGDGQTLERSIDNAASKKSKPKRRANTSTQKCDSQNSASDSPKNVRFSDKPVARKRRKALPTDILLPEWQDDNLHQMSSEIQVRNCHFTKYASTDHCSTQKPSDDIVAQIDEMINPGLTQKFPTLTLHSRETNGNETDSEIPNTVEEMGEAAENYDTENKNTCSNKNMEEEEYVKCDFAEISPGKAPGTMKKAQNEAVSQYVEDAEEWLDRVRQIISDEKFGLSSCQNDTLHAKPPIPSRNGSLKESTKVRNSKRNSSPCDEDSTNALDSLGSYNCASTLKDNSQRIPSYETANLPIAKIRAQDTSPMSYDDCNDDSGSHKCYNRSNIFGEGERSKEIAISRDIHPLKERRSSYIRSSREGSVSPSTGIRFSAMQSPSLLHDDRELTVPTSTVCPTSSVTLDFDNQDEKHRWREWWKPVESKHARHYGRRSKHSMISRRSEDLSPQSLRRYMEAVSKDPRSSTIRGSLKAAIKVAEQSMSAAAKIAQALSLVIEATRATGTLSRSSSATDVLFSHDDTQHVHGAPGPSWSDNTITSSIISVVSDDQDSARSSDVVSPKYLLTSGQIFHLEHSKQKEIKPTQCRVSKVHQSNGSDLRYKDVFSSENEGPGHRTDPQSRPKATTEGSSVDRLSPRSRRWAPETPLSRLTPLMHGSSVVDHQRAVPSNKSVNKAVTVSGDEKSITNGHGRRIHDRETYILESRETTRPTRGNATLKSSSMEREKHVSLRHKSPEAKINKSPVVRMNNASAITESSWHKSAAERSCGGDRARRQQSRAYRDCYSGDCRKKRLPETRTSRERRYPHSASTPPDRDGEPRVDSPKASFTFPRDTSAKKTGHNRRSSSTQPPIEKELCKEYFWPLYPQERKPSRRSPKFMSPPRKPASFLGKVVQSIKGSLENEEITTLEHRESSVDPVPQDDCLSLQHNGNTTSNNRVSDLLRKYDCSPVDADDQEDDDWSKSVSIWQPHSDQSPVMEKHSLCLRNIEVKKTVKPDRKWSPRYTCGFSTSDMQEWSRRSGGKVRYSPTPAQRTILGVSASSRNKRAALASDFERSHVERSRSQAEKPRSRSDMQRSRSDVEDDVEDSTSKGSLCNAPPISPDSTSNCDGGRKSQNTQSDDVTACHRELGDEEQKSRSNES